MNPSVLIIERPGSFRDALVSEIQLSGASLHVRDDAMDALATLQAVSPNLVLVSEDPGPPGASSVARLMRSKLSGASVFRLGDASQRDQLDDQSPFVPRAIGPTAIARFLVARAENQNAELARAWDAPLGSLELGPLLLAIAQRQLTGRLVLTAQAVERELMFARGYVVAARSSAFAERLGQVALKQGLITAPQLEQALDQARVSSRRLGEVLLDSNVLDGPRLFSALCAQFIEQVSAACNSGACQARFLLDESVIGEDMMLRLHPVTAVLLAVRKTAREDTGRVLDQLADRTLSTDGTPDIVRRWLEAAGISDAETLLRLVASVRALRERLRERLSQSESAETDADAIALSLLRAGALKLPGRASLVPADLRAGMTTLSPPSVASAVVRCARASFEAWQLNAVQQARTPLEIVLDVYLTGPRSAGAERDAALRGPAAEASEVDPELLAYVVRASGTRERSPGAWLKLTPHAPARELRLALHALHERFDGLHEDAARPVERLRLLELRTQLDRALGALDAAAVLAAPALTKAAAAAAVRSGHRLSLTGTDADRTVDAAGQGARSISHAGDPVLLAQVEPLLQQSRWNELRTLLAGQEDAPSGLPPAFALLYAIALKECEGGPVDAAAGPREQAEVLGIAAVSELLSVPEHSTAALVVAKRALRRRPLEWTRKASGRTSFFLLVLALVAGAAVGLGFSPQLMQLMQLFR